MKQSMEWITPSGRVFNSGDIAWILTASAMVVLMTLGLGIFYGGMTKRKNAISSILESFSILSIVSIQWLFWGYSLAFAPGGGRFYGNLKYFLFLNFDDDNHLTFSHPNAPTIPNFLYGIYQCMFAGLTSAILVGSVAGRLRFRTMCVFVFIWTTIVYCPIAHWVWSHEGWAYKLGVLDFAGGFVVHVNAGFAGLALSVFMRARFGYKDWRWRICHLFKSKNPFYKAKHKRAYWDLGHNVPFIILGTALLWFGWFGFNAGSAETVDGQAVIAFVNTHFAACSGAVTWGVLDTVFEGRFQRVSAVSICAGIVAAMACMTAGSGYVQPPIAVAYGVVASTTSYISTKLVKIVVDDSLDVFSVHGVGAGVGVLLTGIFASKTVAKDGEGYYIDGGWWDNHYIQMAYQLAGLSAVSVYSFFVTFCICLTLEWIPGLGFRVTAQEEEIGLDVSQHGESAYLNQGDEEVEGLGQHEHAVRLIKRLLEREERPRNRDRTNEAPGGEWAGLLKLQRTFYKKFRQKKPKVKNPEPGEVPEPEVASPPAENIQDVV
eukprot:TRINITY_DN144_c0_g1_i1.p1 TRINITY_DN144_c0_g1~~TRINITY_DN144_c0_g1_i1.p1  ORF type:complete len:546 (-),score=89.76 TRINITY_DN144_c0_g1_i1:39-1676(-)